MSTQSRFLIIAAITLLGLIAVATIAQQQPAPSHQHPDLVTKAELWKGVAAILGGNLILALGLAWKGGRSEQVLAQVVKQAGANQEAIGSLREEVRDLETKVEVLRSVD